MILIEITILAPGSEVGKKLGNPQTWTEDSAQAPAQVMKPAPQAKPTPAPIIKPSNPQLDSSMLSSQMTHPIASLSPYQNK